MERRRAVLAILLLALAWVSAVPAAAQRVLTPHDVVGLRTVEEVALSPDGGTAAYVVAVPRRPGRDEDGEPWQVAFAWTTPERLVFLVHEGTEARLGEVAADGLKVLGRTPVRLVLYPQEKHGASRAAAELDVSLRQLRWIEHYLFGPGGEPPPREIDYGLDDPPTEPSTSP